MYFNIIKFTFHKYSFQQNHYKFIMLGLNL
jgi:hypothetical protein